MAAPSSAPAAQTFPLSFARIFKPSTRQALYAMAEVKPHHEAITLIYKTAVEPFEAMRGSLWYKEEPIQESEDRSIVSATAGVWCRTGEEGERFYEESVRVKKVFLQLHISNSPEVGSPESSLITFLSETTQSQFPNLDPRHSLFTIHEPRHVYRLEHPFSPETLDRLDLIEINPKDLPASPPQRQTP